MKKVTPKPEDGANDRAGLLDHWLSDILLQCTSFGTYSSYKQIAPVWSTCGPLFADLS